MKKIIPILVIVCSIFCYVANAQNERYELGKRTRALEVELEKPTSPEIRKKAMNEVNK